MSVTAQPSEELGAPVKLTINGQAVEAREGMTILQAAREAGIEIPTLCHLEQLSGYGSCRMCLVEIAKGRRSRTVVSCLYPVEEGLEVQTESEKVAHHRKLILELLAARWDRVDPALMKKYGADPDRFEKHVTGCYCILCGLCVRHCAEVAGHNVLGFIGRGTERQVVVYPELAAKFCPNCTQGGEMPCLAVCPTGVITSEFAAAGLTLPDKLPLAYPVCIKDDDNVREVAKKVGDV